MADQIADIDRQIDALYDDLQESRYLLYGIMVHQVRAWMCVCVCVCVSHPRLVWPSAPIHVFDRW